MWLQGGVARTCALTVRLEMTSRDAEGARAERPVLLKTEMIAGHGGRSGRYDAWHEEAMVLAWTVATAGAGS
jgi:protease II